MAKAVSPIRLQADLMQAAESSAKRFHRSTAEQIEYWADLGRSVSSTLDPDVLLSVLAGLTKIKTEPVISPPIAPDDVFNALERDRKTGALRKSVVSAAVSYQASTKHLGYLERIDSSGNMITGEFKNGQFITLDEVVS